MPNLLVSDGASGKIIKLSGFSTTILDSFSTGISTNGIQGVGFDGTNIYAADNVNEKVYKYDGFSAVVLDSWTHPFSIQLYDFTTDGTHLYTSDNNSNNSLPGRIYKHDGFTSTVLDSFTCTGTAINPRGIAWKDDTGDMLAANASTTITYRFSGFSNTAVTTLNTGVQSASLAWDGTNLYTRHISTGKVYLHSGFSATVTDSFTPSFSVRAMQWDEIPGDTFTVALKYKNAGASFVAVTNSLGDTGAGVKAGSNTAYWDNPMTDRPNVEVADEVMRIEAEPDLGNSRSHLLTLDSASQLTAPDAVGALGDVKVNYTLTALGLFTDSSSNNHVVNEFGGAAADTGTKKFGTSSLHITGTSDYLTIPAVTSFGSNWTVEFFINFTANLSGNGGATVIASIQNPRSGSGTRELAIQLQDLTGGNGGLRCFTNNVQRDSVYTQVTHLNSTGWRHVAMVQSGSTIYIFVDGIQETGSPVTSVPAVATFANGLGIGAVLSSSAVVPFYMDELRVSNIARYTSNFTAPTAAFTDDANTELLLHFDD